MSDQRTELLTSMVCDEVAYIFKDFTCGQAADAMIQSAIYVTMTGLELNEVEARQYVRSKIMEAFQ